MSADTRQPPAVKGRGSLLVLVGTMTVRLLRVKREFERDDVLLAEEAIDPMTQGIPLSGSP